jgi:hypothetical protein
VVCLVTRVVRLVKQALRLETRVFPLAVCFQALLVFLVGLEERFLADLPVLISLTRRFLVAQPCPSAKRCLRNHQCFLGLRAAWSSL